MSSEASARNPELLAEEVPAKFVNEGVCVFVQLAWLASGIYLPAGKPAWPPVRFFFLPCHAMQRVRHFCRRSQALF